MMKRKEAGAGRSRRRAAFFLIRSFRLPLFGSLFGLLILSSGPALGFEVAIKVSGGLSLMKFDEINNSLDGWTEFRKREAAAASGWTFDGGKVKAFKQGFDFEGEILFLFGRRLALSAGSGYSYTEITEAQAELDVTKSGVPFVYCRPTKVSAHPLIISGYYFLPLGRAVKLYLKGGGGWIWTKYVDREATKKTTDERFTYPFFQSASGHGTVLQGGLGLKYDSDPNLGFFFEAGVRKASVNSLEGETRQGEKGPLYYYEELSLTLELWQPKVQVKASEPAGESFRSVRRAVVDLGGFILRLGVHLKF